MFKKKKMIWTTAGVFLKEKWMCFLADKKNVTPGRTQTCNPPHVEAPRPTAEGPGGSRGSAWSLDHSGYKGGPLVR